MAVDERLVEQARAAAAIVAARQRDLDAARGEFRRAVRAVHLAGGSMREIAEHLGLSHQRVHQLLDLPRPDEPGRRRGWSGRVGRCSFCGRAQREVAKLITGQGGAGICDDCVGLAERVVEHRSPAADARTSITPVESGSCSFCGKRAGDGVDPVRLAAPDIDGARATVCSECLELCRDILTDEPAAD